MEQRAAFIAEHPTPYSDWAEQAEYFREQVRNAMNGQRFHWSKGSIDRERTLTAEDLAIALYAVEQVGEQGLSYGQLQRAWKDNGTSAHRAKAAAALRTLVALQLIRKIGAYSAGRKGNQYRVVRDEPRMDL